MFLKAICWENGQSDRHIHCAVHSTDSVIWSLNIQPQSPSCLVSQQPSNASAVLCLNSALHVFGLASRKILLLLHERQSGTAGISVIFHVCGQVTMGRLTNLLRAVRRNGQSDRSSVVECSIIWGHHIQLQNTKILSTKP